jgi:hypothetical protein
VLKNLMLPIVWAAAWGKTTVCWRGHVLTIGPGSRLGLASRSGVAHSTRAPSPSATITAGVIAAVNPGQMAPRDR